MTALAYEQDPALFMFDQNRWRSHLGECFKADYIQLRIFNYKDTSTRYIYILIKPYTGKHYTVKYKYNLLK